ncbi:unnamed protein product [Caenorhabditis nigoni]
METPSHSNRQINKKKKIDHINQEIDLVCNDLEQFIAAVHNKSWINFVKAGIKDVGQEGALISPFHSMSAASLKWTLLHLNQIVFTETNKCKLGIHAVRVLDFNKRDGGLVSVCCLCKGSSKEVEEIYVEDIIADYNLIKTNIDAMYEEFKDSIIDHRWDLYNVKDWELSVPNMEKGCLDLIEIGQVFEMQLEEDPHIVVLATVTRNHHGLLCVQFGGKYTRMIHMLNTCCHQIGWTQKQKDEKLLRPRVDLIAGLEEEVSNRLEPVTHLVFLNNDVMKHRLERGAVLVYLNHDRNRFYFAHMVPTEDECPFYFHLCIGKDFVLHPNTNKPAFFHIYHEQLFAWSLIRKEPVRCHLPDGFEFHPKDKNKYEEEIDIYVNYFTRDSKALVTEGVGPQDEYRQHINSLDAERIKAIKKGLKSLKYVEILLPTPDGYSQLHAAEVVRVSINLLTLKVPGKRGIIYAHPFDSNVYHFGACVDVSKNKLDRDSIDLPNDLSN